ncbi:hypothetical protein COU20_01985 [Candidatus Kaiserbacteria bacterium CG10_big_fil_rev_8_21_14_0_10_59_10]|uniref:Uncharacterized protein n=1 Tax=Candidatus Kaiserbacteria bacterium CG10_big_fil_rev_8_21_14_0_10_59_10 TaxID=1974612 RepID=A0A2H0U807_9BACT|nr:MAG: hypothetical protein COU20_01985 [Candidatus Kaiserbacteria bacterium CG10_big_fil_rev_8_21_14_0_10_59_10]
MKHLDGSQIQELRALLEAERERLVGELSERGRRVNGDWQAQATGFEGEASDPNDAADNIEELATNVPIVETLETRLREVEEALERMEKGTYGVSEVDGTPIPIERLRANPAAKTNV